MAQEVQQTDEQGTAVPTNAGVAREDIFETSWSLNAARMTVEPVALTSLRPRKQQTDERREEEENAPDHRRHWFLDPRTYPGDIIPEMANVTAFLEAIALEQAEAPMTRFAVRAASPSLWQLLGPGNFSGRINAIVGRYYLRSLTTRSLTGA
jgi:hypothetical protein